MAKLIYKFSKDYGGISVIAHNGEGTKQVLCTFKKGTMTIHPLSQKTALALGLKISEDSTKIKTV